MDTLLPTLVVACIIGILTIGIIAAVWWTIQQASRVARGAITAGEVHKLIGGANCPYCRQRVPLSALTCPHCGGRLDAEARTITGDVAAATPQDPNSVVTEEITRQIIPGGVHMRRVVTVERKDWKE